jgi:hypothetical protein
MSKVTQVTLRDVRYGYLYDTGDLVLVHEVHTPKLGKQEYVTLHRYAGRCEFKGRIVLHTRGAVRLALYASAIRAEEPNVASGSNNTRDKNQKVGYVTFHLSKDGKGWYSDTVTLYELPGLLSGDVTVQPNSAWEAPEEYSSKWGVWPLHVA